MVGNGIGRTTVAALLLVALAAARPAPPPAAAPSAPAACVPAAPSAVDPLFEHPYIDVDEMRDAPARHRYVHGGFTGTGLRFSFYLPVAARYGGRFFQYVTPVPDSETLSQGATGADDRIGFALSSGAYFVETNGGGAAANAGPAFRADPTIAGYRANAAAARFSRVVAQRVYPGSRRPYGYIFGGSGGAYRTLGGIECTRGVWDGAVPFVLGSTMATPYNFTVRMHAMRLLEPKLPSIVDALEPGGSGDPYAGLDADQAAALREATAMGFPLQSWFGWRTMGVHAFTALYPGLVAADPGYFEDFWTKPGYLGFDRPASLARDRLRFDTSVKTLLSAEQATARGVPGVQIPGTARGTADLAWQAQMTGAASRPVAFQLAGTPPAVPFLGGDLVVLSGAARGGRLPVRAIFGDTVTLGVVDAAILAKVHPGDAVRLDNSNFLAAQTYHRHQVPVSGFAAWDQFRRPDGTPIYPQRPVLLGPIFTRGAAGTIPTGRFEGKMILIEALWDREAFPWQADWYRAEVREQFGAATDDHFRVWMIDHALHGDTSKQEDPTHTVSYLGALQQALRDLAAWVERGTTPPASSVYRIKDGQIVLPPGAAERRGIQPTVRLTSQGYDVVKTRTGIPVSFTVQAEAPPGGGPIVTTEWDFGDQSTLSRRISTSSPQRNVQISTSHEFLEAGTYFVAVRVSSKKGGNYSSPYANVDNIARMRVIVF